MHVITQRIEWQVQAQVRSASRKRRRVVRESSSKERRGRRPRSVVHIPSSSRQAVEISKL